MKEYAVGAIINK